MARKKTKGYVEMNGRFYARISVAGKRVNLGAYDTAEEAMEAYLQACEKLGRDPNRPPSGRPGSDKIDRLFPEDVERATSDLEQLRRMIKVLQNKSKVFKDEIKELRREHNLMRESYDAELFNLNSRLFVFKKQFEGGRVEKKLAWLNEQNKKLACRLEALEGQE